MSRRWPCLLSWVAWIVLATAVPLPAADPQPSGNAPSLGTLKDFEGLGFSVVPKGGGKARTALFGTIGEGYKFVYVLDRSGSMGMDGARSLRAVKAELIESLKPLDTVHQFQIIFYNERPTLFNPSGVENRLAFATDQNKDRLQRFLDTIVPDGGTDHLEALRLATSLHPDVIFLLTDGDEPQLSSHELDKVERWATGMKINSIEFGPGAKPKGVNFLEDLAQRTGGQYRYLDTATLPKGK